MVVRRTELWKEVFLRPLTAKLAALFTILGMLQTVREIFPRAVQDNYTLNRLLPAWPWFVWVILLLSTLLILMLEGALAAVRAREDKIGTLHSEKERLLRQPEPRLVFEFGHHSAELVDDEADQPYQTHRVALTNRGGEAAHRAKVQLLHIEPTPATLRGRVPLPLHPMHAPSGASEFDLAPGETRLIDVFQFDYDRPSICHMLGHVDGRLEFTQYELLLEATARNAQRATVNAWIFIGEGSEIWLSDRDIYSSSS